MVARTRTWWSGAYDKDHVFDPSHPMTENEMELEMRWSMVGRRFAIAPGSFVFHYRSVSRGEGFATEGACRREATCEQPS